MDDLLGPTRLCYRLIVLPLTFQDFDEFNSAPLAGGRINNEGQIFGEMTVQSRRLRNSRVVVWQKGCPKKVLDRTPVTSDMEGQDRSNRDYTFATAINARGEVVGDNYLTFSGAYSGTESKAYVWADGRMKEIKGFPLSVTASRLASMTGGGSSATAFTTTLPLPPIRRPLQTFSGTMPSWYAAGIS